MKRRQRRLRLLVMALAAFAALVGFAAVLLRVGRPDAHENPEPSVPTATGAPGRGGPSGGNVVESQDEAGATSAALAYASAPQAWLYMTDDEIGVAVADLATTDAADRLAGEVVEKVAAARIELADSAGPIWWIVHPLALKVERFSPTEATVSVWTFSFLSAADVAVPQTEWTTTTFDLAWFQGGWRIETVSESVGPTPAVGPTDQPWEPEPLDDALDGFTRLAWDDFR